MHQVTPASGHYIEGVFSEWERNYMLFIVVKIAPPSLYITCFMCVKIHVVEYAILVNVLGKSV